MEMIMQSLVIVAMFALRLLGPIVVVLALAYVLKGLDRHWQAQAEAERRKSEDAETPTEQPTVPQPGVPRPGSPIPRRPARDVPGPQLPYDPTGRRPLPGIVMTPAAPCWENKSCSESARAECAAPRHSEQPCWQARFQAEGHIPVGCLECDRFDPMLPRDDEKQTGVPLWRERCE